jgi:hypothetical protein
MFWAKIELVSQTKKRAHKNCKHEMENELREDILRQRKEGKKDCKYKKIKVVDKIKSMCGEKIETETLKQKRKSCSVQGR